MNRIIGSLLVLIGMGFLWPAHLQAEDSCPSNFETYGQTKYYEECFCKNKSYPMLAELIAPYKVTLIPIGGTGHRFDKGMLWSCGVSLEWMKLERPIFQDDCQKKMGEIQAEINDKMKNLPEEERPHGISYARLGCF